MKMKNSKGNKFLSLKFFNVLFLKCISLLYHLFILQDSAGPLEIAGDIPMMQRGPAEEAVSPFS
jgi:hypothetical protein